MEKAHVGAGLIFIGITAVLVLAPRIQYSRFFITCSFFRAAFRYSFHVGTGRCKHGLWIRQMMVVDDDQ